MNSSYNNPQLKINTKKFIKIFFLALLVTIAVSYEQVAKQIFDYKEVYFGSAKIETQKQEQEQIKVDELKNKFPYSEKNNFIEIPKLNIEAPIIFTENSDSENLEKMLDKGVTHFPLSVLPLEKGTTIFLGHSAPAGWPKIKHDWVFSDVAELEKGDEILIYFDNKKITYYVTNKIFLEKGEKIPEQGLTNFQNTLVLISCWPPGKDSKRIAIISEPIIINNN